MCGRYQFSARQSADLLRIAQDVQRRSGEGAQLPVPAIEYGGAGDDAAQAHHLFAALRALDRAGARVAYARAPERDGVAMAVYNRLLRAAAFRVVEV